VVGYVNSVMPDPKNRFGGSRVATHESRVTVTCAFLWRNGTMTAPFAPSESEISTAIAINNKGDILGRLLSVIDNRGHTRLFSERCILLRGGREYKLIPPSRSRFPPRNDHPLSWRLFIEAFALGNTGQVVGHTETPDGEYRACLWRSPGKEPIILRGGTSAFGIDGRGRIGLYQSKPVDTESSTCELYLYDHGRLSRIGPGSEFPRVVALAMNRSGDVLMKASTGDWYQALFERAFLWSNGVLTALPSLAERMGGDEGAEVASMNGALVAVGTAYRLVGPPPHGSIVQQFYAFRFDCRTGRYTDLNSLVPASSGWTLEQATGINDRGQIIGVGQHRGKRGAFLLTPRGR